MSDQLWPWLSMPSALPFALQEKACVTKPTLTTQLLVLFSGASMVTS